MNTVSDLSRASGPHDIAGTERIAAILAAAVDSVALPGVVACAADRDGQIYHGALGVADIGRGTKMRDDTLFFIASMTKLVTHIAVLQLVEQGRLGLDDRAADYLPALARVAVLEGFSDDGAPVLRPPRGDITMRHLLGYTAGFAYPYWNAAIKRYVAWAGLPDNVSYRRRSLDLPLVSDPGTQWHYGIGSEFLGLIVERISGERLDNYMRAHIFAPLGMDRTGYAIAPDDSGLVAAVHTRLADGGLSAIALTLPQAPEFYPGGVGLFSTAGDYLALTRMLLCGGALNGHRVLRAQTVAMMTQDQLGSATIAPMRSCDPFWSCDVDLLAGQQPRWGAGLMLNPQALDTGRAAFSMGWGGACNSFYWIDRTRGVTGVFMAGVIPFCDPKALAAFTRFEKSVYALL